MPELLKVLRRQKLLERLKKQEENAKNVFFNLIHGGLAPLFSESVETIEELERELRTEEAANYWLSYGIGEWCSKSLHDEKELNELKKVLGEIEKVYNDGSLAAVEARHRMKEILRSKQAYSLFELVKSEYEKKKND